MRVLVLSQYFWPESFVINDIVRCLQEQGHDIVVATGKPNYPDGTVFPGYRAAGLQREQYLEGIEVVRVPIWPRGRGGALNLSLNYLSFVVSGLCGFPWLLRGRAFDAILVFSPSPITQVIPAILLKWLKRARLAVWVQDLWPESLAATGFVRQPALLHMVGWMVRGIYRACDLLLVQSRAFVEPVSRYGDPARIRYLPNALDVRETQPPVTLPSELQHRLDQQFCVVFAGNLGTAQALDTLLRAAEQLRDQPDVSLVLVGSGSRLSWLEERKQALGLDNLVLPGRFPPHFMPAIFERAAALVVSLNGAAVFAQTVPSKVQAYLAAGRPILASLNGEGARVVGEAGAGLVSAAEDVQALVDNIRRLHSMNPSERQAMGDAGKRYFMAHFEMTRQVRRLADWLCDADRHHQGKPR